LLNILYKTIQLRLFFLNTFSTIGKNLIKHIWKNYCYAIILPDSVTWETGIVFPFIIDDELVGGAIFIETSEVIKLDDIGVST